MAPTFPLSASAFLEIARVWSTELVWMPMQSIGRQGSGQPRSADLGPGYWKAICQTQGLTNGEAEAVRALSTRLNGAMNAFRLYPTSMPYPQNDLDGSIYGASTPIVTNRDNAYQADMSGFPADYEIKLGDWVQITYDTSREYLGQFTQNKTANGSGVVSNATLSAPLPASVANGDAVNLIKPAGLFKLVLGSFHISVADPTSQTLRFEAEQVHEAA